MANFLIKPAQGISHPFDGIGLFFQEIDFSDLHVAVGCNYYDGFMNEVDYRLETLRAFFGKRSNLNDGGYNIYDIAPEYPIPPLLAEAIRLEDPDSSISSSIYGLMHAGLRSAISPLHFDWDNSWIINACMKGVKTFYFIPPENGWLLSPIINTSSYCVPRMSEHDINKLLALTGGSKVTIKSGEAVLFPSIWWHGVLYDEDALSVSIRFNNPVIMRPLTVLPRSWWLQRLIWRLHNEDEVLVREIVNECLEGFFSDISDWEDRYDRMNRLYQQILGRLHEENGVAYLVGDNFNSEYALAYDELLMAYDVNFACSIGSEQLEEIRSFLFDDEYTDSVSKLLQEHTAIHAYVQKQGLPPKRGIILNR